MVLGSFSTTSIEEAAEASGCGLRWLQLNIFKDRDLTRSLVARAERAGYKAIVVTVDQPVIGQTLYQCNIPPPDLSFPNLGLRGPVDKRHVQEMLDPSLTWGDVDWVRGLTRLPVVVKGILRAEDAVEAVRHGVEGIIVSNHGGRQLDGALASVSGALYPPFDAYPI